MFFSSVLFSDMSLMFSFSTTDTVVARPKLEADPHFQALTFNHHIAGFALYIYITHTTSVLVVVQVLLVKYGTQLQLLKAKHMSLQCSTCRPLMS